MDESTHRHTAPGRQQVPAAAPAGAAPALSRSEDQHTEGSPPAEDEFSIPDEEQPEQEVGFVPNFEEQLKLVLEDAFPLLMDRLKHVHFADWHRRSGLELDLGQRAMLAVLRHCRDKHVMPADIVGYLVTTARNLAVSDWKKRRIEPVRFADLAHVPSKPGTRRSGRVTVCEEETDNDQPEAEESDPGSENDKDQQEEGSTPDPQRQGESHEEQANDPSIEPSPEHEHSPENYLPDVLATAGATATRDRVQAAIEKLPRRQRQAVEIYMRHHEECTFVQMAAMMLPPATAVAFEKNIERAWKTLRQDLRFQ